MKKFVLHIVSICCLILVTSCGISEDCFKGNGNPITQTFPLENFTKIKVYDGVGLVVKDGPIYEVKVVTSDNIIDDIDVKLNGDMLVVKDNSTCNIARDYGQTTVYVTAPNLTEIHSKTDQEIRSDGVLNYSDLKLFSIDISDGAGTGDFRLALNSTNFYVESNNVSNFYLTGQTENLHVFFSWGNGIFYGENLVANTITFYHRGSNDVILFPINSISGDIYSTGNVVLKNIPNLPPTVIQHFRGRLIMN
ncbi:head GIN domain-containing protein [Flavobacterium helocola]|uniref:Head GIN domain-containing protein n=1 Tax=Flavobacterium helocola TaxID=3139139 RepID=A0ABU9I4J6_9FLAO